MKDLLKEAYDAGNDNAFDPASISEVDAQFELWYEENKHRVNNERILAEEKTCRDCKFKIGCTIREVHDYDKCDMFEDKD